MNGANIAHKRGNANDMLLLKTLFKFKGLDNTEDSLLSWSVFEITSLQAFINVKKKEKNYQRTYSIIDNIMNIDGNPDCLTFSKLEALEAHLLSKCYGVDANSRSFKKKLKKYVTKKDNIDDADKPKIKEGEVGSKKYLEEYGYKIGDDDLVEYDEKGRIISVRDKYDKVKKIKYPDVQNYTGEKASGIVQNKQKMRDFLFDA